MIFMVELAILVLLLLLSCFFSGSETALTSLGKLKLKQMIEQKKSSSLSVWLNSPNKLLATILVGNTIVNLAAASLTAFMAMDLAVSLKISEGMAVIIATAVITLAILIIGEITPKTFAKHNPEKFALLTIKSLVMMNFLLSPLVKGLILITNPLVKLLGGDLSGGSLFITEDEIKTLIDVGEREGAIEKEEQEMIHSVLKFGDILVREVMTPRLDMDCVNLSNEKEKIIDLIVETGHSKVPVYKDNLDNIQGIIYVKDILNSWRNNTLIAIEDMVHPPYYVPETKKVNALLREFKKGALHIAVVVDEYGVTAGLVTVEDLVEEIVGDIINEYDLEEMGIEPAGDGAVLIKGKTDIKKVNEKLKIQLPSTDFKTVSGFVVDLMGKVPKAKEEVKYRNLIIEIVDVGRRRVKLIKIKKL
ncbi:MAG: hemolysin family protein [bacterium]